VNVCLVFLFQYTLLTVILKNAAYIECHSAACHFAVHNDILLNVTEIDSVLLSFCRFLFYLKMSLKCQSAKCHFAGCHSGEQHSAEH